MKKFVVIGGVLFLLACCFVSFLASNSPKDKPSSVGVMATNQPSDSPQAESPQSTGVSPDVSATVATVEVTEIPTVEATAVPQPKTPSIEEIAKEMDGMTDAQSNNYTEGLKGSRVEGWQGEVTEVDEGFLGGFTVMVDMIESNFGNEVNFEVSEDVALVLSKGDTITFSGDVEYVSDILGLTVRLENVVIEP